MAFCDRFSCLLLYLLCTCLPLISSQLIQPSNANSTVPLSRRFVLIPTPGGMEQSQQLDPLTDAAGVAADFDQLKVLDFQGPLILTDTPNIALTTDSIAFVRCDPEVYNSGPTQRRDTIAAAIRQNPQAIVLYSVGSDSCRATNFDFKMLYTTLEPEKSYKLEQILRTTRPASNRVRIRLASRDESSGDGNGFMKSPTTAVAMIILYSITGIITALFLVIIVVGAIRAHRHPERYWPRNEPGRPRQSRAKGIARAMLETIPIVKFGDREDEKRTTRGRDVELESGLQSAPDPPSANSGAAAGSKMNDSAVVNTPADGPELVTTETAAGASQSTPADGNIENRTDNGLACSVCTDDFVKGQDIRVLPCNHKFHPECIDPWLLNVSGTCPLCRIDLRPVTSHPDSSPDLDATGNAHSEVLPASAEPTNPPPSEAPNTNRRSRAGLSVYIQNTLNLRRMRDATPEERIAALRHLRTVNGALPLRLEARSALPEGQRRRRLSARLSRAWGTSSRPASTVHVATPVPEHEIPLPVQETGTPLPDHGLPLPNTERLEPVTQPAGDPR